MNKADALFNRTNMLMGTAWRSIPTRFTGIGQERPDLVVTAVDNLATRQELARTQHCNALWLDMGCSRDQGQVVLGRLDHSTLESEFPNVVAHFPEMMERVDDNQSSCSAADRIQRQDLMVNQAVAGAAANLLWQALRKGAVPYNGVMIDLGTAHSQAIPFMPLPENQR